MAASVAALAVIATLFIATGLERSAKKQNDLLARAITAIRRANAEMADFNDDVLSRTRAQADLFRATLLNESRVASFKQEQQPFWRVTESTVEKTQEYKKVRLELTKIGSLMSDWPRIVETVQTLQSSPGMTVRRIEVLTAGDANQRTFDRITLGVTLFARITEKN
jgi:hypothetical protein